MIKAACCFVTAGRDTEARLVELLAEIDQDVADRVRLRLALGLSVAEVAAVRLADVRTISGAAFLHVRDVTSGRVRVLPLGLLHAAVIEPRARAAQPGDTLFPPADAAIAARAFAHAAHVFPGIDDEAIGLHYAHRHGAPKTAHARREAAFIAKGRLPPGMGWF